MRVRALLRGSGVFLYFVLVSRIESVKAEAFATVPRGKKRYYEHDVHLDGSKHIDQFFSFVTRPDLDAPRWDIEVLREDLLTPGYWFAAPYSEFRQGKPDGAWNAPHIYDGNGELVWSGAEVFDGFTTFDFRVTNVQGRPMLSLIYPRGGKAIIFDDAYRIHKTIDMGEDGLNEDEVGLNAHEFTTTENGTKALYFTRLPKRTSKAISESVDWDGNCYAVFDEIQELDTESWKSTNRWSSEGRISLNESYVTKNSLSDRCAGSIPWDYFHANSIDTFPNGDYLVSGRRTSALYRVSRANGTIMWRLGGLDSDFTMPFEFHGQHAAKIHKYSDTRIVISMLDNAFLPPGDPQSTNDESRGLLVELDMPTMAAKILAEFPHPKGIYTMARGNVQMLPNDNAWICWTDDTLQSEHSPDGELIMKARLRPKISSYRSFKFPWVGRPDYPPDVHSAIIDKNGQWHTVVHMSWNGATEIRQWAIYQTNADGEERQQVAKISKEGFETSVWTDGYASHVVAEALDGNGDALGESRVFASLPPRKHTKSVNDSPSSHESWLDTVMDNPLPLFIFGIAIGVSIGVLVCVLWRRCGVFPKFTRSRERDEVYEPLTTTSEEESFALERFEDNDGLDAKRSTEDENDAG